MDTPATEKVKSEKKQITQFGLLKSMKRIQNIQQFQYLMKIKK